MGLVAFLRVMGPDEKRCCKEHGQSVILDRSEARAQANQKSRSAASASSSTRSAAPAKPQIAVEFRVVDDATGDLIRQQSDGSVYIASRTQPIGPCLQ